MIKRSIQLENVTITSIYVANLGAPQYMPCIEQKELKLIELEVKVSYCTI